MIFDFAAEKYAWLAVCDLNTTDISNFSVTNAFSNASNISVSPEVDFVGSENEVLKWESRLIVFAFDLKLQYASLS